MNEGSWVGVAVAALGAAAVGLERQWSGHAAGPAARFAGLRTFTLLGAAGGLAGWLAGAGFGGFALIVAAAAASLIVVAYWAAARNEVEATTEVAALVVLAAAVLAGVGHARVASGIFIGTALLLAEKSQLHAWVSRLDDVGLRAGLRFGAMAVVVLPLLPQGPIGPLGVEPRAVWLLVLFFSGVSFAGFVARRLAGIERGYWITGLLGGLVSSTNVTLTFARLSRADVQAGRALAAGVIAANTVLFPRVWVATAVLNAELATRVWWWLVGPFVVGAVLLLPGTREQGSESSAAAALRNPLQVWAALQMAVCFQVVLIVVRWAGRFWGDAGVYATAAVLGLTDVDALTVSMSHGAAVTVDVAASAIALGILANTLVKCAIAVVVGDGVFRRVAGGALAAMACGSALSLWWLGTAPL